MSSPLTRHCSGVLPENDSVIEGHRAVGSEGTVRAIAGWAEFASRQRGSPFYHHKSLFNSVEVILRRAQMDVVSHDAYLTNFIGVRVDPKFAPDILERRQGEVEQAPIPANWHADIAEWSAALRAVDLARDTLRVVELGCGWGLLAEQHRRCGTTARAGGVPDRRGA